jgi:hypothetical protein
MAKDMKRTKRSAEKRSTMTYETSDPVLAGVLLMDNVSLLRTEKRGDGVAFIFRSRPGLAAQVAEIEKIAEESEQASVEIRARMDAALAADQPLT